MPMMPAAKKQKRKLLSDNITENMFAYVTKHLEKEDDECFVMAKSYTQKLKKMEPIQRLYADRLINEVLLEGQLGNLCRYSAITN